MLQTRTVHQMKSKERLAQQENKSPAERLTFSRLSETFNKSLITFLPYAKTSNPTSLNCRSKRKNVFVTSRSTNVWWRWTDARTEKTLTTTNASSTQISICSNFKKSSLSCSKFLRWETSKLKELQRHWLTHKLIYNAHAKSLLNKTLSLPATPKL